MKTAEPASAPSPPVTATPAPVAPASPPPKQQPVSPYRELAARYLDSDGQGGWRKNEKAATELERLMPAETAQLWPLLKDQQVDVRRGAAVFLLSQFNPANSDQVAAFTALLDDADSMLRARGLDAVRQFSRQDQIATLDRLTALLDHTREERAENRVAAARMFYTAYPGPGGMPPGTLVSAATTDPVPNVRSAALLALAQWTPMGVIPTLVQGLSDADSGVRLVAAARLRQLGSAQASNALAVALADSDSRVAEVAAEALIRIGEPAVAPLAGQLFGSNAAARKLALACLAKLGPAARPAEGQIEKCRQDPDPQVRQLAEAALKRISGK